MKKTKILVSLTTTSNSSWRNQISEINGLKLKEIALFPTCLLKKERKELNQLLKKSSIKKIPLVHLRHDMEIEELEFFIKEYGTEVFNIHTQKEFPLKHNLSKYKKMIYVENIYFPLDDKEIKNFGGICLDLAHLENDRLLDKKSFEYNKKIIKKNFIGCNHLSVIYEKIHLDEKGLTRRVTTEGYKRHDSHYFKNFEELNYLKNYPPNYFSSLIALELENSIKEQLEIQNYLCEFLKKYVFDLSIS